MPQAEKARVHFVLAIGSNHNYANTQKRSCMGKSGIMYILASLPALSCRCMGVAKQINLKPSFA